jgi:hypothetical protein
MYELKHLINTSKKEKYLISIVVASEVELLFFFVF